MSDDFYSVATRLEELAHMFDQEAKQIISDGVQKVAAKDTEAAVRGDIGDLSMSGWRRDAAIPISSHTGIEGDQIVVRPGTFGASWRKGMGPMRVLQDGRRATLIDTSGKKPKLYRMNGEKRRRVKGYSVATRGKSTWSDAMKSMVRSVPKAAREALMDDTVRKLFGR